MVDKGNQPHRRLLLEESGETCEGFRAGNFSIPAGQAKRCAGLSDSAGDMGDINGTAVTAHETEIARRIDHSLRARRHDKGHVLGIGNQAARQVRGEKTCRFGRPSRDRQLLAEKTGSV